MKVTVEDTAKLLGVTVLVVRYGIQTNSLPGTYVKGPGNKKGSYIIHSSQLAEHLKLSEEEVLKRILERAEE